MRCVISSGEPALSVVEREKPVESKIQASIKKHGLFTKDDLVLVAVSGGPDSLTLLHVLHTLGYKIHTATLDHGLREESADECRVVQDFSTKLGIECTLHSLAKQTGKSIGKTAVQETARQLRYGFLSHTANSIGARVIATAHTQDDNVETILLKIIRGTSIAGLSGIPIRRDNIVRSMLDVSREEVEQYCIDNDLHPCRDASNQSTKYTRNEVRLKLLPYLRERFNLGVDDALLRLSSIANEENDYLEKAAINWLGSQTEIPWTKLLEEHVAIQRRVLALFCRQNPLISDLGFEDIEAIRTTLPLIGSITLPGAVQISLQNDMVSLSEQKTVTETVTAEITVAPPCDIQFGNSKIHISGDIPEKHSLVVRTPRVGDRIVFKYGRKKVTDILREQGIPVSERLDIPVLAYQNTSEVLGILDIKTTDQIPNLKFLSIVTLINF